MEEERRVKEELQVCVEYGRSGDRGAVNEKKNLRINPTKEKYTTRSKFLFFFPRNFMLK